MSTEEEERANGLSLDSRITHRETRVEMIQCPRWGIACFIDGVIQSCEMDEAMYHISLVHPEAKRISVALRQFANVIPDYRVPDSIRLAIAPLPTSYLEVWDGFERIRDLVSTRQYEKIQSNEMRVT